MFISKFLILRIIKKRVFQSTMTETGEQDIDGNKEEQNDDNYGFLHFTFWPWRAVSSSGDLKNYTSVLLSSVDCYVMRTIYIVLFFRRKSLFIIAHFTSVYVKRNKSIKKNGLFCFDKF